MKTAQAQTQMNTATAIANANLNRINQYTPEGSLEFKQIGTNPDGTPQYASTQTYSPEQQAIYEGQNKVSQALLGTANTAVGNVNTQLSQPWNPNLNAMQTGIQGAGQGVQTGYDAGGQIQKGLDYSSLGAIPTNQDYSTDAQRVQDAVYNQATSRLDPQWEQQQRQLASTLAAKGVTENSEAYRRAMDQMQRQKTDAYNQANYSGIQAGGQEQSRLFGLALAGRQQGASEIENAGGFANAAQAQQYGQNQGQAAFNNTAQGQIFGQNQQNAAFGNDARQQAFQEQAYQRNLPIQELAALQGQAGGVAAPQFANYANANVANTDYSSLVQNNYNNQMQQYNQQMQARASGLGSIFGTLGTLGSAAMKFSDRRIKHSIKAIGELPNGLKTYVFSYVGSAMRQFGVMADEVIKVLPEAVGYRDGYMTVDYGKVW
jgi:hypothetical protein